MFENTGASIVVAVITAIQVVAVAVIGGLFQREAKRRKKNDDEHKESDKKVEKRAKVRAEESRLSMKMMSAAIELGEATAIAVAGGEINGEMARGRESARRAREEYDAFLERIAAEELTK
jgi:Na+/H+ antiporter NhaB